MQIILSTEDTLRLVLIGLKQELGLTPSEIFIGPVDGEIKTYAAIGESVPNGVFDDDADDDTPDEVTEPQATDTEVKPRKKRVRRTKEQIAADEAAAKAKQAAEAGEQQTATVQTEAKAPDTKQPETATKETAPVVEPEPETAADKGAPADANATQAAEPKADLFADPEPTVAATQAKDPLDLEPEPSTAAQNPFADNTGGEAAGPVSDESLDLFSDPAETPKPTEPVTQTEGGFVKPAGDDKVLDLFS